MSVGWDENLGELNETISGIEYILRQRRWRSLSISTFSITTRVDDFEWELVEEIFTTLREYKNSK